MRTKIFILFLIHILFFSSKGLSQRDFTDTVVPSVDSTIKPQKLIPYRIESNEPTSVTEGAIERQDAKNYAGKATSTIKYRAGRSSISNGIFDYNPVQQTINFRNKGGKGTVVIYNLVGNTVLQSNNPSEDISVKKLPAGVYLIIQTLNNKTQTTKFIKN
jgi:hypothetical protein